MAGENTGHPPSTNDEQQSRSPSRIAVPPAPDESCRDRETIRLPPTTSAALQDLVDRGTYPNRAAAIRAGIRLLLARETGGKWPPNATSTDDGTGSETATDATNDTATDDRSDDTDSDSASA